MAQPVWILILIDGGETPATVGSNNVYHLYIHIYPTLARIKPCMLKVMRGLELYLDTSIRAGCGGTMMPRLIMEIAPVVYGLDTNAR